MQKKKGYGVIEKIITIFLIGVFLYSAIKIGMTVYDYYDNKQTLKEAQEIHYQEDEVKENRFTPLLEVNEDVVGWIKVADTVIDYPILQQENNEYYLTRNYLKEETKAGSIFMDYRNHQEEDNRNTIIYGHDMKDGSMFANLDKYLGEEFFRNHATISYDTLQQGYDVKIFAVYQTKTDFDYIRTDFDNDEEFLAYLQYVQGLSIYKTDIGLSEKSKIITLSTCDTGYNYSEGRLVVQGLLVAK